jgi:CO/xanthine dehydrogenase Mo-binding subunit
MPDYKVTSFPALAQVKVRYTGEAVAMVAAESRYLAEDALELIVVAYEPLPAVAGMEQALAPGAPVLHEEAGGNLLLAREFARGDVDRRWRERTWSSASGSASAGTRPSAWKTVARWPSTQARPAP